MNELLKKNATIKIMSISFAILLWFLVLDSTNPSQVSSLDVQLEVRNEMVLQEKGLFLKNKNFPRNVVVTVKGRKDRLNSINAADISAVLDFSRIKDTGSKELYVDVAPNKKDITIEDWTPKLIKLDYEKIGQNPFRVVVEPKGSLKDGYKVVEISATPEIVSIQGFDSLIKTVGSVKAFVDVGKLDRDLLVNTSCKVYNKNGQSIAELEKDLNVDIRVKIAKEVTVIPVIKGNPAKNYIGGQKKANPDKVLITGNPEILDKVESILTEPVDVEDAAQSVKTESDLKLPEGVKLYNNPARVEVSMDVEHLGAREVSISKDDIVIKNTEVNNILKYEIQTQTLTVTLRGNGAELEQLDTAKLKPGIDVSKLGEGLHRLPLKLTLPDNVTPAEDYFVEVKVMR